MRKFFENLAIQVISFAATIWTYLFIFIIFAVPVVGLAIILYIVFSIFSIGTI